MAKEEIPFDDFLANVNPVNLDFVINTHDYMLKQGCSYKIETAKNGHVVSYILSKTKKVIANYVFRKNGLIIRIYGDNIGNYAGILDILPDNMVKAIQKAPVCKRLIDPVKCNSKCSMGYIFTLKGEVYKKCRYNSFMFDVKDENYGAIHNFLEKELSERITRDLLRNNSL